MENNNTGIYKIENILNHKCYIGQALNIEQRFKQHKDALQSSNKSWYPQARQESNSLEDFSFSILQICSAKELDELEEYWIKYYNSYYNGYNKTPDGQCVANGIKLNIEYTNYDGKFSKNLLFLLETLTKIKTITYTEKLLIILFFTQIDNTTPFFFTEQWIRKNIGLTHDTYIHIRKHLKDLGIFICENKICLTLSIDNLLKIGEAL